MLKKRHHSNMKQEHLWKWMPTYQNIILDLNFRFFYSNYYYELIYIQSYYLIYIYIIIN